MNEPLLLVAPDSAGLRFESPGLRQVTWPELQVQPPNSTVALDEAVENLYGYDWMIFVNPDAVRFFLERLKLRAQDISVLDGLRVCALGEETMMALAQARVHLDVLTTQFRPAPIREALMTFAGGAKSLDRLAFLIPRAAIGRDYLKDNIEEAGARVDVVTAYQTVASEDSTRLAGIQSMLLTGSIDALVAESAQEVRELARVFDTNDLSTLLRSTPVLTSDDDTSAAAVGLGIAQPIRFAETSAASIRRLLAMHRGR